jgi:RNA 2',3'-cyclic 3'-phosphodiesterase
VPTSVAAALEARLAPVRATNADARWLAGSHLHVTLTFIGALRRARVEPLKAALADVAMTVEPFELSLDGAGRFGGRGRPEVAWIGLDDGHAACVELAGRVTAACRAAGVLEPAPAARPDAKHRPHLTVARRAPIGLPAAIEAALGPPPIGWLANELILYRSHLGVPGVRYEALLRLPLGSAASSTADLPTTAAGD